MGMRRLATLGLAGVVLIGAGWLATGFLDGPLGMLPGGRLRGASQPCPASWDARADFRELEIELTPERPRSVRTWGIVQDGALFVPADFLTPWKRWPFQVQADPRVRIRLGEDPRGEIFECAATVTGEPLLVAALRAGIAAKYDIPTDGRAAQVRVIWFRIAPRQAGVH